MESIQNELRPFNLDCTNTLKTDISFREVASKCPPVIQIMKPVPVARLLEFANYRNPDKEYELLKVMCESVRHKETLVSFVNKLNRYTEVKAMEHTLVSVDETDVDLLDRYIHANYIVNPYTGGKPDFIATQGPLPTTFLHFWKMIDREQIKTIYMLCGLVEGGHKKCDLYWPSEKNSSTVIEKTYEVSLKEETRLGDNFTVVREITLSNSHTGEMRRIRQIQITGWPDKDIPAENDLPHLYATVEQAVEENNGQAPILVHCSAGIGRTGTFIALFYLRKLIVDLRRQGSLHELSIFSLVRNLKEQRFGMINKVSQYKILYIAAAHWLRPQ